jgi:hypothetical protein
MNFFPGIVRFILFIAIVKRFVAVISFNPTCCTGSRQISHRLYRSNSSIKLLDSTIVEIGQPHNNKIIDPSKQSNDIMFRSLARPFLIQSDSRNNNQDTDEVYQIRFTVIPLESIDDRNHGAETQYATSTESAICAWNSLQGIYTVPNELTVNTSQTTTTVLRATWTPSLFLFKIEEISETNQQKMSLSENAIEIKAVLSRILMQHTLSLWYNQQKTEATELVFE